MTFCNCRTTVIWLKDQLPPQANRRHAGELERDVKVRHELAVDRQHQPLDEIGL